VRGRAVGGRPVRGNAPVRVVPIPQRGRRLSDGVLVEASILARVLGVRLLTLDATVVLAPADVGEPAAPPPAGSSRGHGGLAEAVRSIDEGARVLARTRRDGARALVDPG